MPKKEDIPDLVGPSNIQPSSGDLTDVIFKAAQLGIQKREAQRQAVRGMVNTFLSIADLNMRKAKQEADNLAAKSLQDYRAKQLEVQQQRVVLEEDRLGLEEDKFDLKKSQPKPRDVVAVQQPDGSVKFEKAELGENIKGTLKFDPKRPGAGGKLSPILRHSFKDIISGVAALNTVTTIFDKFQHITGGDVPVLNIVVGGVKRAGRKTGVIKDAEAFEGAAGVLKTIVAKAIAGEGGRLTEQDIERIKGLILSFTDTGDMRQSKKDTVKALVKARIQGVKQGLLFTQRLHNSGQFGFQEDISGLPTVSVEDFLSGKELNFTSNELPAATANEMVTLDNLDELE